MDSENFSKSASNTQSILEIAEHGKDEPQRAKDIMKCAVIVIRKDESVYEAIRLMIGKNISGLPVVDETGLVGIISEKDLLKLLFDKEFLPGIVEDYMTKDVVSFDEEDSVLDVCNSLMTNHFRRVPILRRGNIVGIISRADLIKAHKDKFKPESIAEEPAIHKDFPRARDIMKCGVVSITKEKPIYEAMEILAIKEITGLPVVDDYMNLVGIISEKDMLNLLYEPKAKPGNVEDFMTEEVVSFSQNDNLFDICDCLMNNHFRRVPILDRGKLVGIISVTDIILHILKKKSTLIEYKRMGLSHQREALSN